MNEFAAVEIASDNSANGPRLLIRDLQTGREIYLDPLELAALAWTRHEELSPLLDPGRLERRHESELVQLASSQEQPAVRLCKPHHRS
jgi:hypothetical protein